MKRQLLLLLLATGSTALVMAQTPISNADGSYSLFYYSPYGSTIIYPDGSHALLVDYDSTTSIIVYSDCSFSRIFYNGSTTTIVHSDASYSIIYHDEPVPMADTLPSHDSFPGKSAEVVKNIADSGYILLSDDLTVKPDPGEARYILLNNFIDTSTMRSRPLVPGQQPPIPEDNPAPQPAGHPQKEPATARNDL